MFKGGEGRCLGDVRGGVGVRFLGEVREVLRGGEALRCLGEVWGSVEVLR